MPFTSRFLLISLPTPYLTFDAKKEAAFSDSLVIFVSKETYIFLMLAKNFFTSAPCFSMLDFAA